MDRNRTRACASSEILDCQSRPRPTLSVKPGDDELRIFACKKMPSFPGYLSCLSGRRQSRIYPRLESSKTKSATADLVCGDPESRAKLKSGNSWHWIPGSRASLAPRNDVVVAYAAFFFGCTSLRFTSTSAIWIAFSAAPLRRLSDTHQKLRPFFTVLSSRIREM